MSLGGISVAIQGAQAYPAPLFRVQQSSLCVDTPAADDCVLTAITIQAPFELRASSGSGGASVSVSENGVVSRRFSAVVTDDIHVLTTCDPIFAGTGQGQSNCIPIVAHADGTSVSPNSQVRPGETVVIYATGLGQTNPAATTGAPMSAPAPVIQDLAVQLNYYPNAGFSRPYTLGGSPVPPGPTQPSFAFLVAGYVGLYQINVPIPPPPPGTPPCLNGVITNLTINVGSFFGTSFDGAAICVTLP
jgi:uncharacterized protein (TIGR03437 family)